jgi:glycosyltransferase involved in cell wall biosynthesis
MNRMDVLITGPSLRDEGGVANYYNAVLPFLKADNRFSVEYFEIGSTKGTFGPLHPLVDQVEFFNAIRRFRPTLVHVNPSLTFKSFIRDGLIIYQARRRGIPVIVFFRGWDNGMEARIDRRLGWFFRMTYARANGFIVLASRFKDKLIKWGVRVPVALETTTVPDGFVEGFSISDKSNSVKKSEITKILYMARLEREKGVIETLEAVTMLLGQGAPVSLTIAGDGPAMDDIRQFVANKAALNGRIDVVGYVRGQTKRDLLVKHHIFCFPSEYAEGMPNSVLEAMAFGMPVITCPIGGLVDFFENGRMGYLVQKRNASLVAEKLRMLLDDRETAANMSDYNHRFATRRFLASDVASRLGDMYLDVVRRQTG